MALLVIKVPQIWQIIFILILYQIHVHGDIMIYQYMARILIVSKWEKSDDDNSPSSQHYISQI